MTGEFPDAGSATIDNSKPTKKDAELEVLLEKILLELGKYDSTSNAISILYTIELNNSSPGVFYPYDVEQKDGMIH